jgi:hypothetical protein
LSDSDRNIVEAYLNNKWGVYLCQIPFYASSHV